MFQKLAPGADCAAVLKADAYGLGADEAGRTLLKAGCQTFFTSSIGEGEDLRRALGAGPVIFALNGPFSPRDVETLRRAALTPVINTRAQAALWPGRFALHIDTGMNRFGLPMSEAPLVAERADDVLLVMSHLACAFEPDHALNARQLSRFHAAAALFPKAPRSLAATAGVQLGADYHFDLARIGVGLYGLPDRADGVALTPTVTIDAPILQIRDVAPGESFGYGASVVAEKPMRAAAVALGYADGFLRSAAGRGYGVLAGSKRPILGRISMDLVILDVTDCPDAQTGARVEFLGAQAPLEDVARAAGTNGYELLTTFAGTVRRTGARA